MVEFVTSCPLAACFRPQGYLRCFWQGWCFTLLVEEWHEGVAWWCLHYCILFPPFFPSALFCHYAATTTVCTIIYPHQELISGQAFKKPLVPTNYFVFFGGGILRPKNQSGSFCLVNVGSGLHCHCSCTFPLGWTGWAYIQCSTSTSVSVYICFFNRRLFKLP
jgi:hypothetical protein